MSAVDFHQVLGVAPDASAAEIKRADIGDGGNQPLGAFDGDIDVGGQRVVAPHPARIDAKPRGLGQQELARGIAANAGEQRRPLTQPRQRQRARPG